MAAAAARERGEISWILTMIHYPTMAANVHAGGGYCTADHSFGCVVNCTQDNVSKHMEDLLTRYGVDVHFTAHSHQYERTTPVYRFQNYSAGETTSFTDPNHRTFLRRCCSSLARSRSAGQWQC